MYYRELLDYAPQNGCRFGKRRQISYSRIRVKHRFYETLKDGAPERALLDSGASQTAAQ